MALYEKSNGLLETHVQWEDIEEEMRKVFGENAKFGENKKATCISDMKGYMSKIALIEPDWTDSQSDLPKQFIVKISSQLAFLEMLEKFGQAHTEERMKNMEKLTIELHNREVGVYELLTDKNDSNIPFTKIYGLKKFDEENQSKGFIISEYVPDIHPFPLYESVPVDDLIQVIKAAAHLSALGEKVPEDQLNFTQGTHILDFIISKMNTGDSKNKNIEMLRVAYPNQYKYQVEEFISLMDKYYGNVETIPNYKEALKDFKCVLTHSDLWNGNMLFTKSGNGLKLRALIDFQACSFTNAAVDLARCLITCLTAKDRRERGDELMNIYYETFVEALDGRPVPYDLQHLKDSYDLYFPLLVNILLPWMMPFLKPSNVTEEKSEEIRTITMDKMIGLLEDAIKVHNSNINKFPKLFNSQ